MNNTRFVVVSIIWALHLAVAAQSGLEVTGAGGRARNRTQRDIDCRENLEYLHDNICCLNCPAGKYVKSPCSSAGERGSCEACDFDTHTEHENGLRRCLKCTKCRSDQDIVRICTSTQDTECECKAGLYCAPDQACEVCKKCSRCKKDEVKARNCTSTSNTVCKKQLPHSGTFSVVAAVIVPVVLITAVVIAAVYWKRCKPSTTDPESNPDETLKVIVECDQLPRLVPLNGEESLRKCFEYFEEMDVDYHKRFFRAIGIHDNVIKSRDPIYHEDRIHELLNVWMEKVGKEASLNDLLSALLALNQRLTAENIMDKAIGNGHYEREKE